MSPRTSSSSDEISFSAFRRGDHVGGPRRVLDRLADALDFAAERFRGDQTGRIIRTAVDAKARAQGLEPHVEVVVVGLQTVIRLNRRNVCIDTTHGILREPRGKYPSVLSGAQPCAPEPGRKPGRIPEPPVRIPPRVCGKPACLRTVTGRRQTGDKTLS